MRVIPGSNQNNVRRFSLFESVKNFSDVFQVQVPDKSIILQHAMNNINIKFHKLHLVIWPSPEVGFRVTRSVL